MVFNSPDFRDHGLSFEGPAVLHLAVILSKKGGFLYINTLRIALRMYKSGSFGPSFVWDGGFGLYEEGVWWTRINVSLGSAAKDCD